MVLKPRNRTFFLSLVVGIVSCAVYSFEITSWLIPITDRSKGIRQCTAKILNKVIFNISDCILIIFGVQPLWLYYIVSIGFFTCFNQCLRYIALLLIGASIGRVINAVDFKPLAHYHCEFESRHVSFFHVTRTSVVPLSSPLKQCTEEHLGSSSTSKAGMST
jgi:hypothetical protein